ncbi:MAG: DUF167 domain-containing protein [archaeon]|jgi:hypothetical protein
MESTKLKLKVSTGKSKFKVELDGELLLVEIKSTPEKGKANKEIIKELKKFFKSDIKMLSGFKSKEKIIEIYSTQNEIISKLN